MRPHLVTLLCIALCCVSDASALEAGVAKVDVTPQFPVRLSGYGSRTTNHQAVAQRIWAKALALGTGQETALLITIDNCGISAAFADDVAARIKSRFNLPRDRIGFCVTHTHSAPMLSGVIPNLFALDIVPEQQAAIDRYTRELAAKLEDVAVAALKDRRPARVSWSEGKVSFAMNRRAARAGSIQLGINTNGPVDHSLPMLVVSDETGKKVRAIWAGYACHCTTMGGEFNQVHGDWAGCAGEQIERQHPDSVALISIGCGGDSNPNPRGKMEYAEAYGRQLAQEVERMLVMPRTELAAAPRCSFSRFDIDFQSLPSRAEWEQRAQQKGIVGYHARKNLARLDRGETLPTTLPYTVQTWTFGTNLAVVFLAGEVVIDYQLRLKHEFDRTRLWVNGYANDVPCYIPSVRVLREGGYEAQDSLWYYDRPTRLSTNIEERIIRAVHEIMPANFRAQ
jgi:hypothetical protein